MDFNKIAIKAMQEGKRVSLSYHGEKRLVEVHALGLSRKSKPCVRVYQVIGGSVFSDTTGWKMMLLSDIEDAKITDELSAAPRPGYHPGDRGMSAILMEIPDEPQEESAP